MIETVKFATTATIHAARNGKTICGSEIGRAAGAASVTIRKTVACEGEVSCKRCLKLMAKGEVAAPKIDMLGRALALIEGFADEAKRINISPADYARAMRGLQGAIDLAVAAGATKQQVATARWIRNAA